MTDSGHLQLIITTPKGEVLRDRAAYVVVPTTEGYIGILPRHIHLVSILSAGVLSYRREQGGQRHMVSVSAGFVEVAENEISVLADAAERPDEIDIDRARQALQRAERRLETDSEDVDALRARAAIERAVARLKAAGAYREESAGD